MKKFLVFSIFLNILLIGGMIGHFVNGHVARNNRVIQLDDEAKATRLALRTEQKNLFALMENGQDINAQLEKIIEMQNTSYKKMVTGLNERLGQLPPEERREMLEKIQNRFKRK